MQLRQQLIDSLERQLREERERGEQSERARSGAFERQVEWFEQQRLEMGARVEKMQQEIIDKERAVA